MISGLCLFTVREASKGFLISLRASNRYKATYLVALEGSLAFLAQYAEEQAWPPVGELTTEHLEDYLVHLATRPKWFGERGAQGKASQSYVETQYRRFKRFFGWLVQRGHLSRNPMDLIPHPKVDEKVVPTVSERDCAALLAMVDPKLYRTPSRRFRAIRDRAMIVMLIDTPGRKTELGGLTTNDVDIDGGRILVMGKGGRERWMHLGAVAVDALWQYLQARASMVVRTEALWVDIAGKAMDPDWLRRMLYRVGKQAAVPNLHPHRFRHTFAVNWLRAGESERVLMIEAGWKKVPETYFRTLDENDAARAHRRVSPADRLGKGEGYVNPVRPERRARGRL